MPHNLYELSKAVRPVTSLPDLVLGNIRPFDYQIAAVQQSFKSVRHMPYFAHRPGAGKTGMALTASLQYKETNPVIVICPPTLVGQWRSNALKWTGLGWTTLTTGDAVKTVLADPKTVYPARYIVPDSLLHTIPQTAFFDLAIWDEVHRGKSRDARRTRAFFGYGDDKGVVGRSGQVIGMSGTPMPNSAVDLWPYIQSAAPHIAKNFAEFCHRYSPAVVVRIRGFEKVIYPHAINTAELAKLMRGSFLIRPSADAIDNQLPPLREETYELKTNNSAKIDFAVVCEVIDGGGTETQKEDVSRARRLLGVEKAFDAAPYLTDLIEGGNNPVIWCWHREVAETISAELMIPCVHGGVPIDTRHKIISEFIDGKTDAIVATIGSMGVGVDGLQHRTDLAVYIERSSVPMDQEQATARIARTGQTRPVRVIYITTKDPIDVAIERSLARKSTNIVNVVE